MSWFYAEAGAQKGPVSDEEFNRLVQAGTIGTETLVWREGMADWKPYRDLAGAGGAGAGTSVLPASTAAAVATTETGVCSECGRTFPRKDMVAYGDKLVCGGCRDVFFQKVREGVATSSVFAYGGFWIRFVAKIIDGILLFVVNMVIQLVAMFALVPAMSMGGQPSSALTGVSILVMVLMYVVQFTIVICYNGFFVGRFGATPGKMALSLRVVRPDGSKLTTARAFGRAAAEMVSGLVLYIGYIIAAFDAEKRALHDHICDTRVIKTSS